MRDTVSRVVVWIIHHTMAAISAEMTFVKVGARTARNKLQHAFIRLGFGHVTGAEIGYVLVISVKTKSGCFRRHWCYQSTTKVNISVPQIRINYFFHNFIRDTKIY